MKFLSSNRLGVISLLSLNILANEQRTMAGALSALSASADPLPAPILSPFDPKDVVNPFSSLNNGSNSQSTNSSTSSIPKVASSSERNTSSINSGLKESNFSGPSPGVSPTSESHVASTLSDDQKILSSVIQQINTNGNYTSVTNIQSIAQLPEQHKVSSSNAASNNSQGDSGALDVRNMVIQAIRKKNTAASNHAKGLSPNNPILIKEPGSQAEKDIESVENILNYDQTAMENKEEDEDYGDEQEAIKSYSKISNPISINDPKPTMGEASGWQTFLSSLPNEFDPKATSDSSKSNPVSKTFSKKDQSENMEQNAPKNRELKIEDHSIELRGVVSKDPYKEIKEDKECDDDFENDDEAKEFYVADEPEYKFLA